MHSNLPKGALGTPARGIARLFIRKSVEQMHAEHASSELKRSLNSINLISLGIGNILCPFFGGIPATGALARTATNIKAGARSPLSSVIHALFVLACTISLAPLVAYLPMAAMAGLLLIVARNMSEARHFFRLIRVAPRSDVGVLLTCFLLTVMFDMVIAVTVGVMLAALLFMRRMAVLTHVSLEQPHLPQFDMPPGVKVYEIAGPLFFGAAKTAMGALATVDRETKTVIISMKYVPNIDATGLVAFETALDGLQRAGRKIILAAVQPEVAEVLDRAGIKRRPGALAYAPDIETAASMAIVHAARAPATPSTPVACARRRARRRSEEREDRGAANHRPSPRPR